MVSKSMGNDMLNSHVVFKTHLPMHSVGISMFSKNVTAAKGTFL